MNECIEKKHLQQGSLEWLALRKTKITATDAVVILGISPWKTKLQLFNEKRSKDNHNFTNSAMQRGLDLEEPAREFFTLKTGIKLIPKDDPRNVVIHPKNDWMMASFDGISECGQYTLEIKCPGEKDHSIALSGKTPDHYFPQLQHQIEVKKPLKHFYLSFDGFDGPILEVKPDLEFIDKMLIEEKKFYDCLMTNTPPELSQSDYIERSDEDWIDCALEWKFITDKIKQLEKEEENLRNNLIFLSQGSNTRGAGISVCCIERRGAVDYSKIKELKGVDLEKYRKPSSISYRIAAV